MQIIGLLAGLITLLTYVPQAIQTLKTRQAKDLSLGTLIMVAAGAGLWLTYGLLGRLPAIWVTNIVVLALSLCILTIKITSEFKSQKRA